MPSPRPSFRPRPRFASVILAAGLLACAVPSLADLTITVKTDGAEQKVYLAPDKMGMQSAGGFFVFDGDAEVMRIIDSEGNERTMTKKDLEAMRSMSKAASDGSPQMNDMMAQARKQAEEAIKDLPPDQQAEARKYLEKSFPGSAPTQESLSKTYEPMNKTREIDGYTVQGYAIKAGDETVGEIWVSSLDDLGLSKKDFAVVGKLRTFFGAAFEGSKLAKQSFSGMEMLDPESDRFIGFPVRTVENEGGVETVTELVGLDKGKIGDEVWGGQ